MLSDDLIIIDAAIMTIAAVITKIIIVTMEKHLIFKQIFANF